MAFLDALKNMFGKGASEATSEKLYIVDAGSMDSSRQKQLSPHQQISVLKRLAAFAKKEKITIHAVLDGKPLRVVADGGDFSGVLVFFTRGKFELDALIKRRLKMARAKEIIVITDNQKLCADIESAGAKMMSASTFKKALGGGDGRVRKQRESRGGSDRRPRRSRSGGNAGGGNRGGQKKKKDEKEHVSDLIDLVD